MEWVASTFHTTPEHSVSSITTADAHTSAASSRPNWHPCRFKWTYPFRRKTKSGFCTCAITFQTQSAAVLGAGSVRGTRRNPCSCYLARLTTRHYCPWSSVTKSVPSVPTTAVTALQWRSCGAFRKIAWSDYYLRHVCLSVCPCACNISAPSGTDLNEIWYFGCLCRISVEKIQVSLKFDKNNGYFTWRPM